MIIKRNKEINSFYEAQNEFGKSIMDLNPNESLRFFNELHESVLDSIFVEDNIEKYKNLNETFYELIHLAFAGDVSVFPTQWLESTIERTAKYYDETKHLKRLLNIYPVIMEFRRCSFELLTLERLKKQSKEKYKKDIEEEIKDKKEFLKELYDKLNERPFFDLFKNSLSQEDYEKYIEFPIEIYNNIYMS